MDAMAITPAIPQYLLLQFCSIWGMAKKRISNHGSEVVAEVGVGRAASIQEKMAVMLS